MSRISENDKAIYCTITKNAGHSMQEFLDWKDWKFIEHRFNDKKEVLSAIGTYFDYAAKNIFRGSGQFIWDSLKDKVKNYFVFGIVRNPYDRYLSGWFFCHRAKVINQEWKFYKNWNIEKEINPEERLYRNFEIYEHIYASQTLQFGDLMPHINYFMKLENIDTDIREIRKRFHIRKELPKRFSSPEKLNRSLITPTIKKYIDEKFHDDFINFGYEKVL